jgi:hypothetical protein
MLAKSYPPAAGERIAFGLAQDALSGGSVEPVSVFQEIRIPAQIFPGEAGRVERPQVLIRARSPPIGVAHRRHLPLVSYRLLGLTKL